MSGLSVVILSKNIDNLIPCVRAVRENEPDVEQVEIVVVDDGIDWTTGWEKARPIWDTLPSVGLKVVTGERPFIFARNANIGIKAAKEGNDVILLNDDALLTTPGGFSTMKRITDEWWPQTGILAATCDNVGNMAQHRRTYGPDYIGYRIEDRMVCFVCVLIPRDTIDLVGLLDEEFVGYGAEDDSYCLRTRQAGLGIAITDLVYVDHGSLTSSFRGGPTAGGDFRPNLKIFIKKYGVDNWGRGRETSPFADLFPPEEDK